MSKTVKISLVTAFTVVLIAGIIACGGGGGGDGSDNGSGPQEYTVSSSTGGSLQFTSAGVSVSLSFPAGAVSTDTLITVDSSASVYDSNVIPGLGFLFLPEGLTFDEPVTMVVTYDEADLDGADESELKVHRWADPDWQRLPSTVDTVANTVTATLSGFSEYFLFPAQRKLYFTADDGSGYSVWSWDGSELVMEPDTRINNIVADSFPQKYQVFNDKLYFVLNWGQLWSWDGYQAVNQGPGTTDILAGAGTSLAGGLLPFNDKLYFEGRDGNGIHLWSYSASAGFTTELYDTTTTIFPKNYMVHDGKIFFQGGSAAQDEELWSWDGINTPQRVADINSGSGSSKPDGLTSFNGKLYFSADDGIHGRELWAYSSTQGAYLVKDIFPGDQNDDGIDHPDGGFYEGPNQFTPFNGKLYFAASSTTRAVSTSDSLWVTDGTAEGTTLMPYPIDGFSITNLFSISVANDLLYFYAQGSYGSTFLGGLFVYDPADETTPRVIGSGGSSEMIWWNYLWYFKCRPELEPYVYEDYYGLCSTDGISNPVMEAYVSTNPTQSQMLLLEDSALY
jgi:ELWxxDGT repeat protein